MAVAWFPVTCGAATCRALRPARRTCGNREQSTASRDRGLPFAARGVRLSSGGSVRFPIPVPPRISMEFMILPFFRVKTVSRLLKNYSNIKLSSLRSEKTTRLGAEKGAAALSASGRGKSKTVKDEYMFPQERRHSFQHETGPVRAGGGDQGMPNTPVRKGGKGIFL